MRKLLSLLTLLIFTHLNSLCAAAEIKSSPQNEPYVWFTAPKGWMYADTSTLPPNAKLSPKIKIMVIGKGQHPMPPTMNLFTEPYTGTLKQYLKMVKSINDAQGHEWKDLGNINTASGPGSLSQMDTKTEWGHLRMMQVILLKDGHIYILTASALKEEFSNFYKEFFASMRSLRISKDLFDTVNPPERQKELKTAYQSVINQWKTLLAQQHKDKPDIALNTLKDEVFNSEEFKTKIFNPFKELLSQKFADMGLEWQSVASQKLENDLFDINH